MTYSPASRAARLHRRAQEARDRGKEDRARMLLSLHRAYVAEGLALTHEQMGSVITAQQLTQYAAELRQGART